MKHKRTPWSSWVLVNGIFWIASYFGFVQGDTLAAGIATFGITIAVICAFIIFSFIQWGAPAFFKHARTVPGNEKAAAGLSACTEAIKTLAIRGQLLNMVRESICDVPLIVLLAATGHPILAGAWAFQYYALFRYRYFYRTALHGLRDLHNDMCMKLGQPEKCISEETHAEVINRMDGIK